MHELIEKRALRSKHFDLENGQQQLRIATKPLHVAANIDDFKAGRKHAWHDIDRTYVTNAQSKDIRQEWQGIKLSRSKVSYTYESKMSPGWVEWELLALDGVKVRGRIDPQEIGGDIWYKDIVPGFDIQLVVRTGYAEVFKWIRTPQAPRTMLWKRTQREDSSLRLKAGTAGKDNFDRLARIEEGARREPGVTRRNIEIATPVVRVLPSPPGLKVEEITERWTGKTYELDAQRRRSLSDDVEYPVRIDDSITQEGINADADDGATLYVGGATYAWDIEYGASGNHIIWDQSVSDGGYMPAYRFTSIPTLDGTETIDSATLTLEFSGSSGAAQTTATIAALIASVGAMSDVDTAHDRTAVSGTDSFPSWGGSASGSQAVDVATIIANAVGDAGWSVNQDLILRVNYTLGTTNAYTYIDDQSGGSSPATLDVTFTPAGGGGGIEILRRRRM